MSSGAQDGVTMQADGTHAQRPAEKTHWSQLRLELPPECHEWGIKMWTATIDFTKAFDSITHRSIGKALKSCGIEHDYISLLEKIYRNQKASVQTDEESNMFEIKKGSDPLSSLLFNMVLQNSLKEDIQRLQQKKEWKTKTMTAS